MELRQLEYFLMVSKLNSFTRAAENLYVSQPTVTSAIRSLEEELGIQLFDRSQKVVALTNEGRVFLKHVEHVMHDVSTTISEMNELKNLSRGTVKIALPPAIAGTTYCRIFALFKRDYPALDFIIMEPGSRTAKQMLLRDETELAVIVCGEGDDLLDINPLFEQKLVACISPGHRLANHAQATLAALQSESLLLLSDDCDINYSALRALGKNSVSPAIVHTSSHVHTLLDMAAAGLGVALLTQAAAETDKRVMWLPLNPPVNIKFGLARKKDKYLSNAAQAFMNFTKGYFPR